MLVLSREKNEVVKIGDNIDVKVNKVSEGKVQLSITMDLTKDQEVIIDKDIKVMFVDTRGRKARLGFVAPDEVPIFRQELYDTAIKNRL